MRPLVLLFFLLLVVPLNGARGQSTAPPDLGPGGQLLTAEDLAAAGVARLSDLFRLLDDWYAVSIEGYTWQTSANGLAPLQQDRWVLLVDDHPIDLRILDQQTINSLPLSISQIAYVEVINTPQLVAGLPAATGALHIHTRQPTPGATVEASFTAANEIGDPGPFRYTSITSPNIDRIGPTVEGSASIARGTSYARVHARADEHHATDERIRERVRDLYVGEKEPRLFETALGFDAGATGLLGTHRLFAGFSRFQDLTFAEPLGREVPRDHRVYHAGVQGDFFPGAPVGFNYRASYTVSDLDPRASRGSVDFDWRQDQLRGHYEVRYGQSSWQAALGLSADVYRSITAYTLDGARLTIPRAYGRVLLRQGTRAQEQVTGYVTRVQGVRGFGLLGSATLHPSDAHTVRLAGSVLRQPFEEHNTIWYWIGEGYRFFETRGAAITLPSEVLPSTTATADVDWTIRPTPAFQLTLSGGFRRFTSLTLADHTVAFDALSTGFITETVVRPFVAGRVTKAGADVRFKVHSAFEQRLHYTYLRYPADDDAFYQAWRNQPWHRFSYTALFTPLERLSLYARLSYHSSTIWTDYFQAAAASNGRYVAELPDYWLLDLSAQKRFWGEHARLSLSLRNFLLEAHRTHPAGAITNLVFQVRLQARFNAGA